MPVSFIVTFLTEPKKSVIGTKLGSLLQVKYGVTLVESPFEEKIQIPEKVSPGSHSGYANPFGTDF